MEKRKLNRRDFLRLSAAAAMGAVAAACAPAAPQIVEVEKQVPIEREVVKTVVVEKEKVVEKVVAKQAIVLRMHGRLGTQGDHFARFAKIFNDDHYPDIYVKNENFPGADYFKKVNTMIAGGTIGDAMWISSIEGYFRMAATGAFAPLDPFVDELDYDLAQYEDNAEMCRVKGKLYALPWCCHPGRTGLYYSKPMLDEAGLDYPDDTWTHEDLLDASKVLTKPDEGVYGFSDPEKGYFSVLMFLRAWGADFLNEEGTKCMIKTPEAVDCLHWLSDLYHKHKIAPPPAEWISGYRMFAAQKLAMFQTGFWGKSIQDYVAPDTWGVARMPLGPAGVRGSMYEFDIVAVTANSKHPKETFMYLTYQTSHEAGVDLWKVAGSVPGARPDVWEDPESLKDPHFKVNRDSMREIMPLWLPWNFRETEYAKTITEELDPIWLGEKTVEEAVEDTYKAAQAVLDKDSLAPGAQFEPYTPLWMR